jgi:hypothetical protein
LLCLLLTLSPRLLLQSLKLAPGASISSSGLCLQSIHTLLVLRRIGRNSTIRRGLLLDSSPLHCRPLPRVDSLRPLCPLPLCNGLDMKHLSDVWPKWRSRRRPARDDLSAIHSLDHLRRQVHTAAICSSLKRGLTDRIDLERIYRRARLCYRPWIHLHQSGMTNISSEILSRHRRDGAGRIHIHQTVT